jgi:FxsC-like protein
MRLSIAERYKERSQLALIVVYKDDNVFRVFWIADRSGVNVHASAAATAPYFFLSYAHKSRSDDRDDSEAGYWVGELFRDLCRSVEWQAGLLKGASSGFMDRERRSGNDWPIGLVRALAGCRVFVPLYSSRYFADEYCGKEWNYFSCRKPDPSVQEAPIVPGIWDPVEAEKLPQSAQAVQLSHRGSDAYETLGLYGIMKVSRYRTEYVRAVSDLAGWIVAAAERHPVTEGPAVDLYALESAFGHVRSRQGRRQGKQLRITVVAPRRDELPAERMDSSRYGPSALDWNPYAPDSARPIVDDASDLARSLGFLVEVGDLPQHETDLLSGDPQFGPQILIVDPWALLMPHTQQLLQRVNDRQLPWVRVVIPWSAADEESQQEEGRLRVMLDAAFGSKLAETASISEMAAQGVPSRGQFDEVLGQLIGAVAKRYLSKAAVFPPVGGIVERPWIS